MVTMLSNNPGVDALKGPVTLSVHNLFPDNSNTYPDCLCYDMLRLIVCCHHLPAAFMI